MGRLLVIALLLAAGAAAPAESRTSPGPTIDIQSAAVLAPDGSSLTVQVLASCPERWSVVEAVVGVSQTQASGKAAIPLTCIGSVRPFTVTVPATAGVFQLGEAQASASVDGVLKLIPPKLRDDVTAVTTVHGQNNRCPGATEHKAEDGSNPWKTDPAFNCDPSQTLPGD